MYVRRIASPTSELKSLWGMGADLYFTNFLAV